GRLDERFLETAGTANLEHFAGKKSAYADKASPMVIRGAACGFKQRHIPAPPDTSARSRLSKGWNGFVARRVGGGPLLLQWPRVAGRRDVRDRPGRPGPRLRPRTRRGDSPDRRP